MALAPVILLDGVFGKVPLGVRAYGVGGGVAIYRRRQSRQNGFGLIFTFWTEPLAVLCGKCSHALNPFP